MTILTRRGEPISKIHWQSKQTQIQNGEPRLRAGLSLRSVRLWPKADIQHVAEIGKMVCETLSLGACFMLLGPDGYGAQNDLKNKNQ